METSNVLSTIILDVLRGKNYVTWSVCMKNYLLSQDLWDIVEETTEPPKLEEAEEEYKGWRKKNAAALYSIQNSCDPKVLSKISEIDSAKEAWNTLTEMYRFDEERRRKRRKRRRGRRRRRRQESEDEEEKEEEDEEQEEKIEENGHEKKDDEKKEDEKQQTDPVKKTDEYIQFQPLIHAINKGKLDDVMDFFKLQPEAKNAIINSNSWTALHVACNAGQVEIVAELVGLLSPSDLEMQDKFGSTPLSIVAGNGVIKIAECLIKKNQNLVTIANKRGYLPVELAAFRRYDDMTRYLYTVTPLELLLPEMGTSGSLLIVSCLVGKVLDVALDLIGRCPRLTTLKNSSNNTPIYTLSRMTSFFPSGNNLPLWKRLIYSSMRVQLHPFPSEFRIDIPEDKKSEQKNIIIQALGKLRKLGSTLTGISGMKKLYETKLMHLQGLKILDHMCKEVSTLEISQAGSTAVNGAFFRAVQYGTVEFVVEMAKANPQLLYLKDKNARGIFQVAVEHRQEKIFSLLYGLDTRKDSLVTLIDKTNNTISHLAGLLAPSPQLARISGAPLQMQRELQWYKEVESIVGSMHDGFFNSDRQTPRECFTKNHKKLVKEGEEWMKETASSSTVVGALIITIMFTAAFTLPGGNDQNTGYPMFLHKKVFTTFIVSDAISLFFSSTSVLMFLAILTSRYAEEDFLKSLPIKLIIGLSSLFISIASMMIAFCAALILMLKGNLSIIVPLVLLACIPITFFIQLQFPLLLEIFMSTYGPSIFDKKMKAWL